MKATMPAMQTLSVDVRAVGDGEVKLVDLTPRPANLLTGTTLPSGATVEVNKFVGRHERMLYDAIQTHQDVALFDAFIAIATSVCTSLNGTAPMRDDILMLDEADRRMILIMARRRATRSGLFRWAWECPAPRCGQKYALDEKTQRDGRLAVDLDALTYIPISPEVERLTLGDGRVVTWERPTGKLQREYLERVGLRKVDPTQLKLARRVRIAGQLATEAQLDDLDIEDAQAIAQALARSATRYGLTSASIEWTCSGCGRAVSQELERLPGFFFQAAAW